MQNGWETGKKIRATPIRNCPYTLIIYSSGKEPQPYLLNF